MQFKRLNRIVLFLALFFPTICLSNLSSNIQEESAMNRTEMLRTINPNLSERKIEQLLKFDEELSFIKDFEKEHDSKELIHISLNLSNLLKNALKNVDKDLMISSQKIKKTQLTDNILLKNFHFHITSSKEMIDDEESLEQFDLFILLFSSNSNDIRETYLLAEKEFLFSLFPTSFPNPDVKKIGELGTAAAKIFPQSSDNFVWIYKNSFFSIKNSNTYELSLQVARELQNQIEKNIVKLDS